VIDGLKQLAQETKDKSVKAAAEDAVERISRKSTPDVTSE
jgi:hypothetical protein